MRKFTLILLVSLLAFVLLIIGAGTAAAFAYSPSSSPGKAKVEKAQGPPGTSQVSQQQLQFASSKQSFEYYYIMAGEPQREYVSFNGGGGYYTGGGEGGGYYYGASDTAEISEYYLFSLHSSELEKSGYGGYYYDYD